jgi:hypothetical protein
MIDLLEKEVGCLQEKNVANVQNIYEKMKKVFIATLEIENYSD